MRDPALRAALITEDFTPGHPFNELARNWRWLFPLDNPPDYAPPAHMSMAGQAAARGCTPQEIAYDRHAGNRGARAVPRRARQLRERHARFSAHEMLRHPHCVPGLGDGGAHYGAICDASYSTYLLTQFVQKGDGPLDGWAWPRRRICSGPEGGARGGPP